LVVRRVGIQLIDQQDEERQQGNTDNEMAKSGEYLRAAVSAQHVKRATQEDCDDQGIHRSDIEQRELNESRQ